MMKRVAMSEWSLIVITSLLGQGRYYLLLAVFCSFQRQQSPGSSIRPSSTPSRSRFVPLESPSTRHRTSVCEFRRLFGFGFCD